MEVFMDNRKNNKKENTLKHDNISKNNNVVKINTDFESKILYIQKN